MGTGYLFAMLYIGMLPHEAVSLPAARAGHVLVLNQVFLNGAGPFRMFIDTGNASSVIRPKVARQIGARAAYLVDQVTTAGVRRLPAAVLDRVTTGPLTERSVETIIGDVALEGVDGVLGQSWLGRHNYLLDYQNRRVVLDGTPPEGGLNLPLHSADGRPLVTVTVDGRRSELVLDSGAPVIVLFGLPGAALQPATIRTNGGSIGAEVGSARIALPGDRERHMRSIRVSSLQQPPGLLPASAFSAVFVSTRDGFLRLTW